MAPWQGRYKKATNRLWLRWYDQNGQWLLTEAEIERQRADKLAQKLRELGIDPDAL